MADRSHSHLCQGIFSCQDIRCKRLPVIVSSKPFVTHGKIIQRIRVGSHCRRDRIVHFRPLGKEAGIILLVRSLRQLQRCASFHVLKNCGLRIPAAFRYFDQVIPLHVGILPDLACAGGSLHHQVGLARHNQVLQPFINRIAEEILIGTAWCVHADFRLKRLIRFILNKCLHVFIRIKRCSLRHLVNRRRSA